MIKHLALSVLVGALAAAPAMAQVGIDASAVRNAPTVGPVRISDNAGFRISAGAPVITADLIDVAPGSTWVIEGPIRMAIEGFVYFGVECTVYSGGNVIGRFQRGSPLLGGPFEGRFRFGVIRSAPGDITSYGCFANVYGTRNGQNWRAYEEPNANIAGGYAQFIRMQDGSFWNGAPITEQVLLSFHGVRRAVSQPSAPSADGLRQSSMIPDDSWISWRPPIVPPHEARDIPDGSAVSWRPPVVPPLYSEQAGNFGGTPWGAGPSIGALPGVPRQPGQPVPPPDPR